MKTITLFNQSGEFLEELDIRHDKEEYLMYRGRLFVRMGQTDGFIQKQYLEVS